MCPAFALPLNVPENPLSSFELAFFIPALLLSQANGFSWNLVLLSFYFCFFAFLFLVLFEILILQLLVLASLHLFLKLSSLFCWTTSKNVIWLLFNCFSTENWSAPEKKQKNIKPTKRWAESKTLKAERVNYDSLSYKNREKLFKESSEIAVFGYFKQQHELDLSVTIRQHLKLEKNYLTKGKWEGTWLCWIKHEEKKFTIDESFTQKICSRIHYNHAFSNFSIF